MYNKYEDIDMGDIYSMTFQKTHKEECPYTYTYLFDMLHSFVVYTKRGFLETYTKKEYKYAKEILDEFTQRTSV